MLRLHGARACMRSCAQVCVLACAWTTTASYHGVAWYAGVLIVSHNTSQHSMAYHVITQRNLPWHITTCTHDGMSWHVMARRYIAWHAVPQHSTTTLYSDWWMTRSETPIELKLSILVVQLILVLKLDKQFFVEQFETTASQSSSTLLPSCPQ